MPEQLGGSGVSRRGRRSFYRAMGRSLLTVTAFTLAYFLLPFDRLDDVPAFVLLTAGLAVVFGLCVWQVSRVLRVDRPIEQAAEALATVFGAYLIGFATVYYLLSLNDPGNFGVSLTKLDALYFTVTVFATVGFGDIVASSQLARGFVLVQMIGNLLLLGTALRLITGSARVRQRQLRSGTTGSGR
ncbi:potassium channel family protein [Nocardia sp. NPDC058058]|uniref:potassium channel family protein n=1 Tax=Nocardia sp. NPDC058058 TaxID=3346317 RepID=UPI0036D7CAB2